MREFHHTLNLRLTPGARLALVISYSIIIVIGILSNFAILAPFLNNKVTIMVMTMRIIRVPFLNDEV